MLGSEHSRWNIKSKLSEPSYLALRRTAKMKIWSGGCHRLNFDSGLHTQGTFRRMYSRNSCQSIRYRLPRAPWRRMISRWPAKLHQVPWLVKLLSLHHSRATLQCWTSRGEASFSVWPHPSSSMQTWLKSFLVKFVLFLLCAFEHASYCLVFQDHSIIFNHIQIVHTCSHIFSDIFNYFHFFTYIPIYSNICQYIPLWRRLEKNNEWFCVICL